MVMFTLNSMFPLENKSLISEKILTYYRVINNKFYAPSYNSPYFELDGSFNEKEIVKRLFPMFEDVRSIYEALDSYQYEDYVLCYSAMLPIFEDTTNIVNFFGDEYFASSCARWIGVNGNFYCNIVKSNRCCKYLEHTLLLTSLLESALSNIYHTETNGRQPPHLLKDLINTNELQNVFGLELTVLLRIIMGSPKSINLRNIIWHGFPKEFEIPCYYKSFLLAMMYSLGRKIISNHYVIVERPLVMDFSKALASIGDEAKREITNIEYIEQKLNDIDNAFAKDFIPYWLQLCSYYKNNENPIFIISVLPQIELLLRLHYKKINLIDVSAKLDEYYITIDTIFEVDLKANNQSDGKERQSANKLLDFKSNPEFEGPFHLIYDVFLCPNGCRLRDKVSHGEVCWQTLQERQLASVVYHIFLNLLHPLHYDTLKGYESRLHLNCLNKQLLVMVHQKLQHFRSKYLFNGTDFADIIDRQLNKKVLIFQRHRKEAELMLLIKMILENQYKTLENYEESIAKRLAMKAERGLHSKRRRTLENLQNAMPEIVDTLCVMFRFTYKIYFLLQNGCNIFLDDELKLSKSLRLLKHGRTISENFVKYSHIESNEWIKAVDLCHRFKKTLENCNM
ncbi:endoplasmic reticulum membrane-associated RNA degradation protein-like [Haematobia irritans]|uniref:endoplasmic reticulum membrane-associated RNA degradation protein-like n=1 Tax=Haematobia irritans TaxID=7368 RepID=UPI003F4F5C67